MHLNDDWNEFLRVLTSTGTRYLLIGGHAVAVHAEPRFTEDLDVFVQPSLPNARRLREALVEFGFGSVMPEAAELAKLTAHTSFKQCPGRVRSRAASGGTNPGFGPIRTVRAAETALSLRVRGAPLLE